MNCYVYIRVSTEEQKNKGYSPDNQLRQCREYAETHKYHVTDVFDDSGRSGRTTDRPELQRLLKTIEEKPVEAIIIYKIDRFARNVNDFSRMYGELKEKGIKLLSINEGDLMGGNSLIPNIFASVAQWESEVNGQRTRDALTQKFIEGWQPTPPPIGYRSVGDEKEKKTCEPDPRVASIIKELFELYSTGNYSILEIQDWLEDKNIVSKTGTSLGHSVIHTILNNPFYYGLIRWKGEAKMGNHIPIISKNLYDVCQYVLAKHRNFLSRKRTHDFLLRGFMYCENCGQRYTAEWHKNERFKKHKGKIAYYHCPKRERNGCPSQYVEMTDLEHQTEEIMNTMQFTQPFIDAVVTEARKRLDNSRANAASLKQAVINQKTGLETRRNTLEDNLLDGTIDREVFKRKHAEIQEKIKNLNNEIQKIENSANMDMTIIEEVLAFTRDIYRTYKEAPDFMKRYYLRFFYEKLIVRKKKIYRTAPTPIFLSLQANQAVIIRNLELPLKDLFINRKIELDYDLEGLQTFYAAMSFI